MPAHISLITLGVADVAKSTAFYEQLGFVRSKRASQESVSFFQAGPLVLALWGRDEQRDDAQAAELWTGNGGIVVAQNVASEDAVDVMMARAEAAGARMLKPAAKTSGAGITAISPIPTAMSGRSPSIPSGNSMKTAGLDCRNNSMTEFLFVYGTLRSEFPHPLAKRLSTRAKFIGKGSTPGLLYDFGWYPGARFDPHARTHVIGEVFSLKNAERLLAELDHYEGTAEPGNAFRRVPVKVRLDRGRTVDAWSYEMGDSKARRRPIESGDFIHHRRLKDQRPVRS